MAILNPPANTVKKDMEFSKFSGIDLANEPTAVAQNRSPNCLNMLCDLKGKPIKRFGYKTIVKGIGRVYGIHKLVTSTGTKKLIHAENKLYLWNTDNTTTLLYTGCNKKRSTSFVIDCALQQESEDKKPRLWFLDGLKYLVYDGATVVPVDTVGYIPTTTFASLPNGKGSKLEDVNLLSPYRINKFTGTATDTVYQLDSTNITEVVKCEKSNGITWSEISKTGYTVNNAQGTVTFTSPIGAAVLQKDNLRITYKKEVAGHGDKINNCTIYASFGINSQDIIFVAGNKDYPNYDFYSGNNQPNYFADTSYSIIGQSNSKIMGYHKVTGYLAVIKEENNKDATVFLRNGEVIQTEGIAKNIFYLKQATAGEGAVSPQGFVSLGNDHMFLTKNGVMALYVNTVSAERYLANRSGYVNPALVKEADLNKAVCTTFKGFAYFALNNKIYLADGNQPKSYITGGNTEEYSYEWFLWDNIDVECFYTEEGVLYFGNGDGVNMFHNERTPHSYTDNEKPIYAYMETPLVYFSTYEHYKTITDLYTRLMPASRSSVKIFMKRDGAWEEIDSTLLDMLYFDDVDFNRFSFNSNSDCSIICTRRLKEKKVKLTQFRFENSSAEAFGVFSCKVRYLVKGNIK